MKIGTSFRAKYSYDILGRRTQRIDYSRSLTIPDITTYTYNGDNIISEYKVALINPSNGTGTLSLQKNYINSIGTDSLIAYEAEESISVNSPTKITNRYYYHLNQLGLVVAIKSSTGSTLIDGIRIYI